MALKQVKNKIISTQKTGKVTKAMESVSAVKMRKSQERALMGKPYAEAAVRILGNISRSRDISDLMHVDAKENAAHCFVVITSDKGLAGALNSAVLKDATMAMSHISKEQVRIIAFGKKAVEYFNRLGYTIDAEYTNVSDDVSIGDMSAATKLIETKYKAGEYAHVSIAYQSFVSTFEQVALVREILPLDPVILEIMVRDIVPKKGRYSEVVSEYDSTIYSVEPDRGVVFEVLLPQLIQIMFYHAMLENKASEHSARMVAMKNATDKSKELIKALTIEYNKARQSVITAEVSEITAGVEAMK